MGRSWKADGYREAQKKLTQAANTISNEMRTIRDLFSDKEVNKLIEAEVILRMARDKIRHLKEKEERAHKNAEKLEADVRARNTRPIKSRVSKENILDLAQMYLAGVTCCDWSVERLIEAAEEKPEEFPKLEEILREKAAECLIDWAPHSRHSADYGAGVLDHYAIKPYPLTPEELTELIRIKKAAAPRYSEERQLLARIKTLHNRVEEANQVIAKLGDQQGGQNDE